MHLLKLLLVLFVCAAGPSVAQRNDPYEAFDRGDYARALSGIKPLAEIGFPGAQSLLGRMYAEGKGVPQDYATALSWFRKAAEQKELSAQFFLGDMYRIGIGVPQDNAAAAVWYRQVAETPYPILLSFNMDDYSVILHAQYLLGLAYAFGRGMPQDYAAAAAWYRSGTPPPGHHMRGVVVAPELFRVAARRRPTEGEGRDLDGAGVGEAAPPISTGAGVGEAANGLDGEKRLGWSA